MQEIGVRAEVFLPIDDGWVDTPQILASVLFTLVQKRAPLAPGQAIEFGSVFPNFAAQFQKHAIYFTDPFGVPDNFLTVNCATQSADIYMGVYLSRAEFEYRKATNTQTFDNFLESQTVDIFHLSRASLL
jgi:hypothetical protein